MYSGESVGTATGGRVHRVHPSCERTECGIPAARIKVFPLGFPLVTCKRCK